MLNGIWLALLLIAVALGALTGQLPEVTKEGFEACKTAVMGLALPLAGVMALWLGIMRLAEKSGAVGMLSKVLRPVLVRIFPDVPATHPAMGSIVMNMAANMLGLSNAATPLGLRAMQDLEKLNPRPGVASNAMCTFLALNTSSVQLIPATAVAILAAKGGLQPTAIIGTALFATTCSTAVGLTAVKLLEKLPMYRLPAAPALAVSTSTEESEPEEPVSKMSPLGFIAVWIALIGFASLFVVMAFFPDQFELVASWLRAKLSLAGGKFEFAPDWSQKHPLARSVEVLSLLAIPFFLTIFPLYAAAKRVSVYEEFVEGAKEGFQVAIRIIPFLVAILAAISMFRAAGGIDLLTRLLSAPLNFLECPPELLPLLLMRPLSGSGSLAIFSELVVTHGPDSLIARMAGTIMGSTETTFYVIAVYFGSVAVRRTRHAVPAGLLADISGGIASIFICNLVFGL